PAGFAEAAEFDVGKKSGNVYENEFFGIRFTLPDGYSFVDDETLAQISGQTTELLKNHVAAARSIENGSVIIYAYANDETEYNTINITLSNVGDSAITEKDVAEASRDELKAFFTENGYKVDSIEAKTRDIAGEEHYEIVVEATYDGYKFYEQVVVFLKDGYNMNITTANYFKDSTDEILTGVTKL
nr:hypothetical protein [Butyrivibrio sp.]